LIGPMECGVLKRLITFAFLRKKTPAPGFQPTKSPSKAWLLVPIVLPILYGILITILTFRHYPYGLGNVGDGIERSVEAFKSVRRYLLFLPLVGLLPLPFILNPPYSNSTLLIRTFVMYDTFVFMIFFLELYLGLFYMPFL
jgi:hypothetical protein